MKKLLGIALSIVGFAALVVAAGYGKLIGKATVQNYSKGNIEERVAATAKQLRKQLPKKVGEQITWQNVGSDGPLLTFNYKIDLKISEFDHTAFLSRKEDELKALACKEESMVKDGGRYRYSYVGEDGTAIGGVEIGKKECEISATNLPNWAEAIKKGEYAVALNELKPLAEQGDGNAQHFLGIMYVKGQGVPQDYKAAIKWHTLAAEQGRADAQKSMGLRYYNGQGVPQDYKTAVKWFTLAAEQGYDAAQYSLARMYHTGNGVPKDYRIAAKWWKLAAEQGHAGAAHNLGVMYFDGGGVAQDYNAAFRWYKVAAEQGSASAQYQLGLMSSKGQGVALDYAAGHMWLSIAAANGYKNAAQLRGFVAEVMDPKQLEEAQRLARECRKNNYKGCG
jgi:TPR repeat protein